MCDRMRINRLLALIGVMIIVLSMTMATQYATTKAKYSFAIVNPSYADIRFIASDNSSDDGIRVLRITNNATGQQYATLELGDWMPNSEKNYTAAFGIVNEEGVYVNISYINVSGVNASYLDIWLHGDRDKDVSLDTGTTVKMVNDGAALFSATDSAWTLRAGDGNPETLSHDGSTQQNTPWDDNAYVLYSHYDANDATNKTSDFVWVQISLDISSDAAQVSSATGTIFVHFRAD